MSNVNSQLLTGYAGFRPAVTHTRCRMSNINYQLSILRVYARAYLNIIIYSLIPYSLFSRKSTLRWAVFFYC